MYLETMLDNDEYRQLSAAEKLEYEKQVVEIAESMLKMLELDPD